MPCSLRAIAGQVLFPPQLKHPPRPWEEALNSTVPQSWEEVQRANQFLKPAIRKMTQETSLKWKEAWLIALLCTRVAPKICLTFNPFETLHCQPFLYSDLLLDTEASSLEADTGGGSVSGHPQGIWPVAKT